MKVCFVVKDLRVGSALLRGYQVSQALSQLGVLSRTIDWDGLTTEVLSDLDDWDIVLFVKEWSPDLAAKIKQQTSARLILDVYDNYNLHKTIDREGDHCELVDAFIVTGVYHQIALKRWFLGEDRPIGIIPHHHTNFASVVNDITKPIKTVGFQGDFSNHLSRALERKLQHFCDSHNLEWLTFYGQKTAKQCVDLPFMEVNNIIHHQLSLIDVGIIFPPKRVPGKPPPSVHDPLFELLLYKPATRLLNFLSHGVPTICYPYISHLEVCVQSGYELFCNDEQCLFDLLERLVRDQGLRQSVFEQGQVIASRYSLDLIAPMYVAFFESLV